MISLQSFYYSSSKQSFLSQLIQSLEQYINDVIIFFIVFEPNAPKKNSKEEYEGQAYLEGVPQGNHWPCVHRLKFSDLPRRSILLNERGWGGEEGSTSTLPLEILYFLENHFCQVASQQHPGRRKMCQLK